jgi:hypothetical protein
MIIDKDDFTKPDKYVSKLDPKLSSLNKTGYQLLEVKSTDDLVTIAKSLGNPLPSRPNTTTTVDLLKPNCNRADRSMSAQYQYTPFPFHTDGAYLVSAPRYVILRSLTGDQGCPTILWQ